MRTSTLDMYNRNVMSMFQAQNKVNQSMTQIGSGKRLIAPSDDPLASSRILNVSDDIVQLKSFAQNAAMADNHLSLVESTLDNMSNVLARIDQLEKSAITGTVSDSDRQTIAAEMQEHLSVLINLANTKDGENRYLFSGFQDNKPYAINNGKATYQGDGGVRSLQVGYNLTVPISYPGSELFENVHNGNGTFQTKVGAITNSGTGIISAGEVTQPANYIADQYTLSFVTNGLGELAYQVTGANSGQVIPALPASVPANAPAYRSGETIAFNGMSFEITGVPQPGDTFDILPSQKQNMFTTIQNMIDILNAPAGAGASNAQFINNLDTQMSAFNQGMDQLMSSLTRAGSTMATLDAQKLMNDDLVVYSEQTLSMLADLDPVEAISQLNRQMALLQTAQLSYAKLQQISLFDYIR